MEENNENMNIAENIEKNRYRTDNRKFNRDELVEGWKNEYINGRIASNLYPEAKERMKMETRVFPNKI